MVTVLAYVEPVPGRLYPPAERIAAAFRTAGGAVATADALEQLTGSRPAAPTARQGGPS